MSSIVTMLREFTGWLLVALIIAALFSVLPDDALDYRSEHYVVLLGAIGMWRYSMGIVHFIRGTIFLRLIFPAVRRRADALGKQAQPSHAYLMVTSFRIDSTTTAEVYRAAIREAIECGVPATVVASIVERADEYIVRALWDKYAPPEHVALKIVRIAGTGKRDGLAYGFRAIAADIPDERAIVTVIDGDSIIQPGTVARIAPMFDLFPQVGGLTTNEVCEVRGGRLVRDWHRLRFAQRHINMGSMALSKKVLTLTGRMSVFRASVVCERAFIDDVENDHLEHWRLGNFRFLTGDDKSTWYSLMRRRWRTYYVPDVTVSTHEHPPSPRFVLASLKLMFRWYGNSLRQNSRAIRLGPGHLGWFTWYVLFDQRVSMWTTLLGPAFAISASLLYSGYFFVIYTLWILMTRLGLTLLLMASGHRISPLFPFLLYYNQVVGSLVKVYVFFRLDRQSWTRQKTRLERGLGRGQSFLNQVSSQVLTFASTAVFVALVITLVK